MVNASEFSLRLGARIREIRVEKGWSLSDILVRGGDDGTWQQWETGARKPTLISLAEICEILEIDLERLLKGLDDEGIYLPSQEQDL